MKNEPAEKQKRNQNDKHPENGLESSDPAIFVGPGRRHAEEDRDAAWRIDDGKQREKCRRRRVR